MLSLVLIMKYCQHNLLSFLFFLSEAFTTVISLWGQIDIVCNNAAVLDEDDWNKTVNTNLVRLFSTYKVLTFSSSTYA